MCRLLGINEWFAVWLQCLWRGCVTGLILPAVCVLAVGYINCNVSLAVLLIIAGVGLAGLTTSITSGSNQLDLAPPYAGLSLSLSLSL